MGIHLRVVAWIALVIGWILVLRGHGLMGLSLIAAFVALRLIYSQRLPHLNRPQDRYDTEPKRRAMVRSASPPPMRITLSPAEARWRRLVLASYGNAYLRDAIPLEHWYRHRALWDAAFTFRDSSDGKLLVSGCIEWLQWMKTRGVIRISLYMADEPPADARVGGWDRQAIRCDFADSHEIWMMGKEIPVSNETVDSNPLYSAYEPDVDAYWRIRTCEGTPLSTVIDWSQMRGRIENFLNRLDTPEFDTDLSGSGYVPLKAYFAHCPDWADLPLLPPDEDLAIPHSLLRDLHLIQSTLENFCHPKNDASPYQSYSADERERIRAIELTLEHLVEEVQCAAGSETRWKFAKPHMDFDR
jgi:hypothetical protein